jgi:hypothetical protein
MGSRVVGMRVWRDWTATVGVVSQPAKGKLGWRSHSWSDALAASSRRSWIGNRSEPGGSPAQTDAPFNLHDCVVDGFHRWVLTVPFLQQHFGKSGSYFYWIARGIDDVFSDAELGEDGGRAGLSRDVDDGSQINLLGNPQGTAESMRRHRPKEQRLHVAPVIRSPPARVTFRP